MEKEKLMELRKSIKSKKPKFIRQDAHKKIKLEAKWRRPKGWQSKIRLQKRGYRKSVSKGYGSPKEVKGFHPTGLKIRIVYSLKDIENMSKEEGILFAKTIGLKKKIEIIKAAKEKGLTLLNIKNPEEFMKKIEERMNKKKSEKEKKDKAKENKQKEAEKKSQEKKKNDLSEKISEDEKKDQEKKNKDKVLTKKE